jgi:hypothetical protein
MDGVTNPTTTHQTLKGRIGDPHFALGYIGHGQWVSIFWVKNKYVFFPTQ